MDWFEGKSTGKASRVLLPSAWFVFWGLLHICTRSWRLNAAEKQGMYQYQHPRSWLFNDTMPSVKVSRVLGSDHLFLFQPRHDKHGNNDRYDVVPPSWEFVGWYSPFASLIYVMYHKPKVLEWETNLAFTICDTTFVFDSIMACWNIPHRWYSQRTEAPCSEVSQLTVHVWYHILI